MKKKRTRTEIRLPLTNLSHSQTSKSNNKLKIKIDFIVHRYLNGLVNGRCFVGSVALCKRVGASPVAGVMMVSRLSQCYGVERVEEATAAAAAAVDF